MEVMRVLRQPVIGVKGIKILGIDPGLSSIGISLIESIPMPNIYKYNLLYASVIHTEKSNKKDLVNIRLTNDNLRRYIEIYDRLEYIRKNSFFINVSFAELTAIAIEAYMPRMQASNAWKTAIVFGGCIFWACSVGMRPFAFLPLDIKKRFCNKKETSKIDVQKAISNIVMGFDSCISANNKGDHEHITDSTGHAILLTEELVKNRYLLDI